jgi:polysaccharide export outer membrane protein
MPADQRISIDTGSFIGGHLGADVAQPASRTAIKADLLTPCIGGVRGSTAMKPSPATAIRWQRFVYTQVKHVLWRRTHGRPSMWLWVFVLCCLSLLGCASHPPTLLPPQQSAVSVAHGPTANTLLTFNGLQPTDLDRLEQLWQQRTKKHAASDYPIGPGDVIEVSVPAMDEINNRVVRVSGDGKIALPLVGIVQAAGLTEEELQRALRNRLEQFMRAPQLNLFVREYRSRQVAVIGAVSKPGLYSLASETDTVLDMITLAGGMTPEAAARVLLIPAERVEPEKAKEVLTALPVQLANKDPSPLILKRTDPIIIDLKDFTRGSHQRYLPLPARPGDVIMVPGAGEVVVQGWVEKPGAYKITPGLTLLGTVAAAGGAMFAADPSAVRLIRNGKDGEKTSYMADLDKIKRGEEPDIVMQEGDVIEVTSSTPKLIPYGMYHFFTSIFRIGGSVPLY